VISRISTKAANDRTELEIGDVITSFDNVPINKLIQGWAPYYGASNEPFRLSIIGQFMTKGECGESSVGVRRGNKEVTLKVTRVASENLKAPTHDLHGPTFRLLSKDVAYLKLSSIKADDAPKYVEQAGGTKGLIIDIRNYPSEFVVFALGSLLVNVDTPFARFTKCDFSSPGTFHWTSPVSLTPEEPHYSGKVVILVDERSLSQAEYTAMAFRAAQGAIVVGSTTAGADAKP
jgi:C-terminal processing protease CtpA/Prc